jgi:hypothetical protein
VIQNRTTYNVPNQKEGFLLPQRRARFEKFFFFCQGARAVVTTRRKETLVFSCFQLIQMSQQVQALLSRLAGISGTIGVGAWVLSESLYNVDGGHAAIIWNRFNGGVQNYVMGEGSHFSASLN